MKDTTHPNFNIPPKKKRKRATWCDGFVLDKPCSDMDIVERERMVAVRNYKHKLIKARS
jgi:hypothetical protein